MHCLSQSFVYPIQALACLADSKSPSRLIRDIAAEAAIPPAFLAKLIKRLADADIVVSSYH